ncbi:MAG: sodium-extruding oxaloacetate decarboxylase subunit alpha [Dehalococcoidales bacterium]|nr:sodium-extruding oxaloacetate decarboxylase subunit alpha [Dehalococcoidales bacterium]
MGLLITDTTLRDAHQSLIATRMRTRDMEPIADKLDKAGFFSLEMWGGATFDACLRFLNEDPWDRLKTLRSKIKNTRLQMLLRGQNIVGYRHYADDVLKEFIRLAVKNGIDVFRVFDALNDIRNMEMAIKTAKEHGAHVQGTMCYTTSPVHTIERFAKMAAELEGLGCDSVCVKDMAGLISPTVATELVKAIKRGVKIPLDLHSHCSSGMAPLSYYAAVLAGVDIVDTTFSPFSWGTSQPPTESIVAAFKDTPYDTGLDLEQLYEIGEYFATLRAKYGTLFSDEATRPSVSVLLHQIPGGMLSNLVSQLKEQNALDKMEEVLLEVPRVRQDLGYPPLVTPTSQLVGTQAVLNVLAGSRYKRVTEEVKNYFLGQYGRPPAEVNKDVRKSVIGHEKPITVRPADMLPPELENLKREGQKLGILHKEEDLITYALYPQIAIKFLRGESKEETMTFHVEPKPRSAEPGLPMEFSVDVDGETFSVRVSPVSGKSVEVEKTEKPGGIPSGAVVSPMAGMVLAVKVKVGDKVKSGDILVMIEAMKMHNEVDSPQQGVVKEVLVYEGEVVNAGDVLMVLE